MALRQPPALPANRRSQRQITGGGDSELRDRSSTENALGDIDALLGEIDLGGDEQLRLSAIRGGGWDGRDHERERAEAAREKDALRGSTMPPRVDGPPRSATPPRRRGGKEPPALPSQGDQVARRSQTRLDHESDTAALVTRVGAEASGTVVRRDESATKCYEKGGHVKGLLAVMFVALGCFMLSVDEVAEMGGQCDNEPCKNGAACSEVVISADESYAFKCICLPGFDGTVCDQDIDECESDPCQNGGACTESIGTYSCGCIDGFYGDRCQADVDECASRPCINRGVCHQQTNFVPGYTETQFPPPGQYSCSCQDGFGGINCDHVLPTERFFSLRGPCVTTDCATDRTVEDATAVLAAALGVVNSDLLNVIVTPIADGDQVNFTLSSHNDEVNGMTVANLLPPGWRVLEAEIQACDESRDVNSVLVTLETCQVNPCAGYIPSTQEEPNKGAETCPGPLRRNTQTGAHRQGGMFPRPDHTRTADGDYAAAAAALGITPRPRCVLVESTDYGVTPGTCTPHPDLALGEVECEYNPGTWDTSNEVVVVDSCTSIQHTTGCILRGSFAGGDETCTPVAEQCDVATASWQAGQAYVPGSIDNPSTTCPDGCIFRKAREQGATNIMECITLYGQLQADVDLELYILEDLSGSFSDDIENLRRLSGRITRTLNQMFRSVRVGIGSFVDVGGYCFHSESIMSQMSEYELQATIGSLNISRQSNICRGSQTPSLVNITQGEASLTALYESTDDYFKLGADGADASATGRNTGCPDTEDGGWCSRIPSVAEVRAQLESSDPPILPVFAIAGEDPLGICGGLCTTEEVDEMKARNEHRLNSYKAVMDRLGRDSSKYVLPLRHDSSDFNEIAAVALRQLVGDLPDECLPGDECAVPHACGSAESCHDTPYGPKRCSGCAPGKAPHPTGGACTLDIDECCSSPCKHNGHCFDSSSGHLMSPAGQIADDAYLCECQTGWSGENCAIDTDECLTAGCQNSAACVSSNASDPQNLIAPGEFECICLAGYTGIECEVDVNECASGPCENRGECSESSSDASVPLNAWKCTCAAGFDGLDCGIDVDECASQPCLNGGVCDQPAPNMFVCECTASDEFFAAHFEGELCETELPVNMMWFALGVLSGILLLITCIMLGLFKYHKDHLVVFTIETLDREDGDQRGGTIHLEMRMKDYNNMYEVVQQVERREGIRKREQRLFLTTSGLERESDGTKRGDEGSCLNTNPGGPSLAEIGIVNGSVVKLLQVWSLNCREEGTEGQTGLFVLPCVERHWRVETLKLKAHEISSIAAETMRLTAPDGTPMQNVDSLTSYPAVTNGCTLLIAGRRPVDRPKPPAVSESTKPTADSVATMAGMFSRGYIPGSHLSELQETALLRSTRPR